MIKNVNYQDYIYLTNKMNMEDLNAYQQQLIQINQALLVSPEGPEKNELLSLKANIEELLELTNDCTESNNGDKFEDEFAAFMAEMQNEGAVERKNDEINLKEIEGKKCKAPHTHQWGNVAYHNAMICSVVSDKNNELKVKVLYTNPTHQEMLPCPFYFESDCKFSEEQCKFSHGEVVLYSSLQEYVQPNFELLTKGSSVLAKQSNNLWYRAKIKNLYEEKCLVKFECDSKELEVNLEHVLPLESDDNSSMDQDSDSAEDDDIISQKDIINQSLMITSDSQALGDWEKYTKSMGSRLMIKMGYIIGTGLGKNAEGRVNPVSAVVFPVGKSLDHCMKLKEQAGGDNDLFSVEKKMKRLQKKQEIQSKKAYERELKKQDVFTFINQTFKQKTEDKSPRQERDNLKQDTSRNLNIKSLQVEKDIKDAERDLQNIQNSLARHTDVTSDVYKKLKNKYLERQEDIKKFQHQAQNIKCEQSLRDNKKKMTIF